MRLSLPYKNNSKHNKKNTNRKSTKFKWGMDGNKDVRPKQRVITDNSKLKYIHNSLNKYSANIY